MLCIVFKVPPDIIGSQYEKLIIQKLNVTFDTLTPREADIIRLRTGFDDGHSLTLEDVGAIYGVTRERIRQIETKALRKLRHPSRAKKLKDFW